MDRGITLGGFAMWRQRATSKVYVFTHERTLALSERKMKKTGWKCLKSPRRVAVEKHFFFLLSLLNPKRKRKKKKKQKLESLSCMLIYPTSSSTSITVQTPETPLSALTHLKMTVVYDISRLYVFVLKKKKEASIKKSFHGLHFYLYDLVFLFEVMKKRFKPHQVIKIISLSSLL